MVNLFSLGQNRSIFFLNGTLKNLTCLEKIIHDEDDNIIEFCSYRWSQS